MLIKYVPLLNQKYNFYKNILLSGLIWDFLGGTVDKRPPANAGDTVQSLGQDDSTWTGQLSPHVTAAKPCSRACALQ